MLAAGPDVAYISEPLNALHRPGVMRAPVMHWYTYICEANEVEYLEALRETLAFRYHSLAELRSLRSRKDLLRMGRDWSLFLRARLGDKRPLLKDPFAVFSAAWFASRLDCSVVITVRHPAAFASSLLRLGWSFNFSDLLAQPHLMETWLEPYRAGMEAQLSAPEDIIGQSCLLWRMIYSVAAQLQVQYPQFLIVRHEDLSQDPLGGFRQLYAALGLDFSPQVQQVIQDSSSAENPGELSRRKVHAVRMDSRAGLGNWKRRLNPAESERVRELTAGVAERYYTPEDWL